LGLFVVLGNGDSDVGDIVMLVTLGLPISDNGDKFIMMATFFVMLVIFPMYKIGHLKLVTNTFDLQHPSPPST